MIPLFVGYAMLVWFLTGRHRRRALGLLFVLAGLTGLMAMNWFHIKLGEWTEGEIYVPVLQTITYPYTALVFAVSAFIWWIPNRSDAICVGCRYDLSGLEPVDGIVICPECGARNPTRDAYRRSGSDRSSYAHDGRHNTAPKSPRGPGFIPGGASAPDDAPDAPDREDAQRQPADERPAEQGQRPL